MEIEHIGHFVALVEENGKYEYISSAEAKLRIAPMKFKFITGGGERRLPQWSIVDSDDQEIVSPRWFAEVTTVPGLQKAGIVTLLDNHDNFQLTLVIKGIRARDRHKHRREDHRPHPQLGYSPALTPAS